MIHKASKRNFLIRFLIVFIFITHFSERSKFYGFCINKYLQKIVKRKIYKKNNQKIS